MSALQMLLLAFVAIGGISMVLTRDAKNQALIYSFYGLLLTLFFFLLQAPGVALFALAVGGVVAVPLTLLLALSRARRKRLG